MTGHEEPTIKPFTADDPEARSADLLAGNVEQLKTIFPEAFTEGKIDFEVLRQLLGGTVEEREEKYGLNWHGKRKARQLALTPSTGTLRPCPEESVEWESTQHLMIEGDNLEVLKLLQKSYSGKVKLIYIDPPYNTGKDFVYPDNFQDNIKNYLELTGQVEGGRKISSNTEASGRFHTDWLNMMYPRLKLARNLLRDDGVIFISIDDNESSNLRKVCDEIFGEENFLADISWEKRFTRSNNSKTFASLVEHILCYRKSDLLAEIKEPRNEKSDSIYTNPDNDSRGVWTSVSYVNPATKEQRPNLYYGITNPYTGVVVWHPTNAWKYEKSTYEEHKAHNKLYWGRNGENTYPRLKKFLSEMDGGMVPVNFWSYDDTGSTDEGSKALESLMGVKVFDFPKPHGLIQRMVKIVAAKPKDLILDFFAGSGTTGHALMTQNVLDSGNRRYILVQLPEPCTPDSEAFKAGYKTIAEITKERLRRAAKKIKEENPRFHGDLGFRVFKLDSSNIRTWEPDPHDLEASLFNSIEHLKADRSEADILYELLLKLGHDLCVPIEKRIYAGKAVHSVGGGVLLVCLATLVTREEVEPLAQGIVAWHGELAPAGDTTCVFRDSAFADDVAKTNLAAILQQHGLEIIRSL
ncbi:MAG: site-specific DNA-methyltransferase [Chlorobaculum sp.]|nr:site-specific DNA-methyltransferase [Chlorobaculum sp.]